VIVQLFGSALATTDLEVCRKPVGEHVDFIEMIEIHLHGFRTPLEYVVQQKMGPESNGEDTMDLLELILVAKTDQNRCAEHHLGCRPWSCDRNPMSRALQPTPSSDILELVLGAGAIDNPLADNLERTVSIQQGLKQI